MRGLRLQPRESGARRGAVVRRDARRRGEARRSARSAPAGRARQGKRPRRRVPREFAPGLCDRPRFGRCVGLGCGCLGCASWARRMWARSVARSPAAIAAQLRGRTGDPTPRERGRARRGCGTMRRLLSAFARGAPAPWGLGRVLACCASAGQCAVGRGRRGRQARREPPSTALEERRARMSRPRSRAGCAPSCGARCASGSVASRRAATSFATWSTSTRLPGLCARPPRCGPPSSVAMRYGHGFPHLQPAVAP